jgi:DnaB-like helicase N terminal domain/AAA domain
VGRELNSRTRTKKVPDPVPSLPHSVQAERAVLGAIILDGRVPNTTLRMVSEHIGALDFFHDSHQKIFRRLVAMSEAGVPVDLVTMTDDLFRNRELDAAGGAAYIAELIDGVPRLSNVEHYARIVREKSSLRQCARMGQTITQAALQRDATTEMLHAQIRNFLGSTTMRSKIGLRTVTGDELLLAEFKPREMLLDPILSTQSLAMIYSKRGTGKTFFGLAMAHAIATGGKFLNWIAPKPRRVLFVDGELPGVTLQTRLAAIVKCSEQNPYSLGTLENLRFITPDVLAGPIPDLATREGQVQIEALLEGTELLILDNLSALCRCGKENEGEAWLPMQEWALRLRQQGVSVLFKHHAGKSGAQRGTSRREDVLDLVIVLRHPSDYSQHEGLRCEVHFEKCRALLGESAKPFEIHLETDPTGALVWTTRTVENAIETRAAELFADGLSVRDVAEELSISKSKAHRLKTRSKNV